ncbi:hypothetical protein [Streptacidiphilus sp. PAMC 29251]
MTKTVPAEAPVRSVESVVGRYLAVWSEADPLARRRAVAELWVADGTEFVEGARFKGHDALNARITEAYQEFVESGKYTVATANDAAGHDDVIVFTIQLISKGGDAPGSVGFAARVFLVLNEEGLIQEDYQLTVRQLTTE